MSACSINLNDSQLDHVVGGWSFFPHPDIQVIRWDGSKLKLMDIKKYKDGKYVSDKEALEKARKSGL